MSKYAQLIEIFGEPPSFNDKVKDGRVLKWYHHADQPLSLPERKNMACEILERLLNAEVYYVQRVEVRNAKRHGYDAAAAISYIWDDEDKICVYIDEI